MFASLSSDSTVTLTLYLLILFSVATWTVVLFKIFQHFKASLRSRAYIQAFWAAPSLQAARQSTVAEGPAARIALTGFAMLEDTKRQIGGRSDIQRAAIAVGHDVDPAALLFAIHRSKKKEAGPGSSPGRRQIKRLA